MKYILLLTVFISGCATTSNLLGSDQYTNCLEAQKSISKDNVVLEAARLNTIVELTKNADNSVKNLAIMALQQQNKSQTITCSK